MHEMNSSTAAAMGTERTMVRHIQAQGAPISHLPKCVRFLREAPAGTDFIQSAGLYEFEVVKGNAAYREGERFYLTPLQAQRVYLLAPDEPAREKTSPGNREVLASIE